MRKSSEGTVYMRYNEISQARNRHKTNTCIFVFMGSIKQERKMTSLIVVLVLILIIVFSVWGIIFYVKAKLHQVEREICRTTKSAINFSDVNEMKSVLAGVFEDTSNVPKSISGMTSIYLPMIARDYPDFNYDEIKGMARQFLTSYFAAINEENTDLLEYADPTFKTKLASKISYENRDRFHQRYDSVKIHQLELRNYTNAPGKHIITFQASTEYYYTKSEGNTIVEGSKDRKCQERYNIDMLHIQDRASLTGENDMSYGYNCPNCGAPIKSGGHIVCKYCGTGIEDFNLKVWSFTDIKKID